MLPRIGLAYLVSILLAFAALACGSGGDDAPPPDPTEPPTPDDATAIRHVDLALEPLVQTAMRQLGGGEIVKADILYADLTGDLREDAVVPISSGGTLGNLGYVAVTLRNAVPTLILTRGAERGSGSGIQMKIEDGRLVEMVGQYGPGDPLCCPTALRRTEFRWDGTMLQVEREERVPSSFAPQKQ